MWHRDCTCRNYVDLSTFVSIVTEGRTTSHLIFKKGGVIIFREETEWKEYIKKKKRGQATTIVAGGREGEEREREREHPPVKVTGKYY